MGSLSYVVDGDSVRIGFGQEYALYHEFGTSKMVRRGLLTENPGSGILAEGDRQDILDVINNYLRQSSGGAL